MLSVGGSMVSSSSSSTSSTTAAAAAPPSPSPSIVRSFLRVSHRDAGAAADRSGGGGGTSTSSATVDLVGSLAMGDEELVERPSVNKCRSFDSDDAGDGEGAAAAEDEVQSVSSSSCSSSLYASALSATAATTGSCIPANNGDASNNSQPSSSRHVHLLGRTYHVQHDQLAINRDARSLLWFSYRCDFPELAPYGYTTDAGWGCMLRASQMMLAQAMRVHYVHRDWVLPPVPTPPVAAAVASATGGGESSSAAERRNRFYVELLTWFADLAGADCPYSLHNMVASGLRYEMLPGEWYGPTTACLVMRDLCKIHASHQSRRRRKRKNEVRRRKKQNAEGEGANGTVGEVESDADISDRDVPRVYVAREGCVYRDAVHEAMTEDARREKAGQQSASSSGAGGDDDEDDEVVVPSPADDPLLSHPLAATADASTGDGGDNDASPKVEEEWDRSLLLLIPLRLGLKTFNSDAYGPSLARALSLRQSVGFLGGSPRHALWFYGMSSDGSRVYGLDPHTVQTAGSRRDPRRHGEPKLSSDFFRSVFPLSSPSASSSSVGSSSMSEMEVSRIDPSLALGFYCRDRSDFDDLCGRIRTAAASTAQPSSPELFTLADAAPNYEADVSVLEEMIHGRGVSVGSCGDEVGGGGSAAATDALDGGEASDEDEFVFL